MSASPVAGLTRSLFPADLSERMADLLPAGRLVAYRPKDVVFVEGDESEHIAILLRGVVKITASTSRGREALLGLRGAGEIVGELAVVDGGRRSATVRALNDVTARLVPATAFRRRLTEQPDALFAVLRAVIARLRESDRRRLEFTGFDVQERVCVLLAELAGTHGIPAGGQAVEITLSLSQQEIAGATGASREAVAKALGQLRERGLVRTSRQKIIVLDPAGLIPG